MFPGRLTPPTLRLTKRHPLALACASKCAHVDGNIFEQQYKEDSTDHIRSHAARAMGPHKLRRTSTFPHHLCDGERPIVLPKHLEKRARRLEERRRRSALSAPHGLAPHCIQVLRARETLQEGAAEARHQDPPAPTWCAHILRRGACGPKVLAPLSPGAARPTALFRCPAQAYC